MYRLSIDDWVLLRQLRHENSITPTVQYGYNALIPYKQELTNQKEEVETNTLDIENNIIPYLMDMEYNLMLMEDN